jgi:hypothetical protein
MKAMFATDYKDDLILIHNLKSGSSVTSRKEINQKVFYTFRNAIIPTFHG